MEIKEKILNNYNNEIASTINKLKEKGFIITTNIDETNDLVKYNCFSNDFEIVDYEIFKDLILNLTPNYWNFSPEDLKEIILNQCLKILPSIDENSIERYFNYIEAKEKVNPSKELKKELKSLLKECKSKYGDVKTGNFFGSPDVHFQVFANKNVVYDFKVNKYYQYSKEKDVFIHLQPTDLLNILRKDSHFYNPNLMVISDVSNYMSFEYKRFLINSSLPHRYNLNKTYENRLSDFKADFEIIDKITNNFK